MSISSKKETCLFLRYILVEGKFNPDNYKGILELGQSAPDSLSRFLNEYNQYLLSRKVVYKKLDELKIKGAYGYLNCNGIYVPKTLNNDRHFIDNAPKVPYVSYAYNYPSIDEFDSIICGCVSRDVFYVNLFDKDVFLGYCADLADDEKIQSSRCFYKQVLEILNIIQGREYVMQMDVDSTLQKEYCLIKRK